MPFPTSVVGQQTEAFEHPIDARWIMAYAASLGDHEAVYMDTAASDGICAHPLFPVCVEWPAILATRRMPGMQQLSDGEAARGIHAAHDLHLYQPIRPGDQLSTQATFIGAQAIRPGASYLLQIDTHNQNQALVARTYQTGIYRQVDTTGEAQISDVPAWPGHRLGQQASTSLINVPAGLAHTYTECARIWNPIHTDRAVALAAGLPDIILHGTATLALAISRLIRQFAGGEPYRVARLGGRFAGMVLMPSTLTLNAEQNGDIISFEVLTDTGELAISQGFMCVDTVSAI